MLAVHPHAYVRCGPQASRLRPVLAAVVAQLAGRKRRREHGYAPTAGAVVVRSAEAGAEAEAGGAAAAGAGAATTTTTIVSGSAAAPEAQLLWELRRLCPPSAPCRVVALDDVQALPAGQAHALLRAVLRLRDHAGANVAVLLMCGADGAATALLGTLPPLQAVRFPPYGAAHLLELLARDAPALPPALAAAVEARAAAAADRRGEAAGRRAKQRREGAGGGRSSDALFYDAADEDGGGGLGAAALGDDDDGHEADENDDDEDGEGGEDAGNPLSGAYRTFLASFVLPAASLCTVGGAGALPQLRALAAAAWPPYGRALAAHPRPLSEDAQLAAHAAARPVAAASLRAFEPGLCGGSGARGAADASAGRAGLGGWGGADGRLAEEAEQEEEENEEEREDEGEAAAATTTEEAGGEDDEDDEDARRRQRDVRRDAKRQRLPGGKSSSAAAAAAAAAPLKARLRAESAARGAAVLVPPLDQAELQLPRSGKLLLVAAYLASRNRASLDRQLFDAGASAAECGGAADGGNAGGGGARRRGGGGGRRRGGGGAAGGRPGGAAMGQDRQVEAAREAALRGPHTFPLQRLVALYRVLRQASASDEEAGGAPAAAAAAAGSALLIGGRSLFASAAGALEGGGGGGGAMLASFVRRQQRLSREQQQPGRPQRPSPMDADGADLLHEVASLVSARLLSAAAAGGAGGDGDGGGGGAVSAAAADAALDAPRFRCDAPPGLVQRCAVELGVNLASLLRYV